MPLTVWSKSPVDKPDEYKRIVFVPAISRPPNLGYAVFSGKNQGFKDLQGRVVFDAASIIWWAYSEVSNESS
jgi:hypothetical protein